MTNLRLPPKNNYERNVIRNVDTFGWHCTSVHGKDEDDESPPFTYSVGLHHSYGGPEFIIFGLDGNVAHSIITICADTLQSGKSIDLNSPNYDLVNDYPCVFVPVPRDKYNDYVYSALWFYAEKEFPLCQIVWPNQDGNFPWSQAATDSFRHCQPVLGVPRGA